MKVIDPNDTFHTIELIPRFYEFSGFKIFVEFFDETTKDTDTIQILLPTVSNGILIIEFFNFSIPNITFTEGATYQLKITDSSGDIVYRGKVFATSQTTQSFKLTEGLYDYD